MGYAKIHLDKYDEDYLIPLPNVKVSGILSGTPYPELTGSYSIVSSNGYIADIDFSGKKLLGLTGTKNSFSATVYDSKDGSKSKALYTAEGTWSEGFTIKDENGNEVERYDYDTAHLPKIQTDPLDQQDPWESQRAWHDTTTALDRSDMQGAADAKSVIEEGQRAMRAEEEKRGDKWDTIFFRNEREDPVYSKLSAGRDTGDDLSKEFGFWKYQYKGKELPSKPYRGNLTPENTKVGDSKPKTSNGQDGQTSTSESQQQRQAESPTSAAFAVPRKPVGDGVPREASTSASSQTPHTSRTTAQAETSQDDGTSPYSVKPLDPRVG